MNPMKNGDTLPGESVKILKEPRLDLSCHWILEDMTLMRNEEDENNKAESQHGVCASGRIRRAVVTKCVEAVYCKIFTTTTGGSTSLCLLAEIVQVILTGVEFSKHEQSGY